MLSIIALVFLLPAAILNSIPVLAIFNGAYDGDQALSAVFGIALSLPGTILVGIDILRRGWRAAKIGLGALALVWIPFLILLVVIGFCALK